MTPRWMLCLVGAVMLLPAVRAQAVDLNGLWRFTFTSDLGTEGSTEISITQTGSDLVMNGLSPYGPDLTGTISGTTFSAQGSSQACAYFFFIDGTVSPDGNSASGDFSECGLGQGFTAVRIPCTTSVCNDFNPCTDDVCDGAGRCATTNNTSPCNDLNACTVGDTCSGGACVPGATPAACGPCKTCDPSNGCVAIPRQSCRRPTASLRAVLSLRNRPAPDDAKDALGWKWSSGAATDKADFGSPTTTTGYELCIFEGFGFRLGARAPAGTAWTESASGFRYDERSLAPNGLRRVKLKAGTAGRASIAVKGSGPNLGMPALPLAPGANLQLVNLETGVCWSAEHDVVLVGRDDFFRAKGD